jgi:hypothetical protein
LRNNSKDLWGRVDWSFTSYPATLTSADGIVYKSGEYRTTCNYIERDTDVIERVCSEGISGGGELKPANSGGIIPPGFQTLFIEEEWKVGEAINDFTYDLSLPVYIEGDKDSYDFSEKRTYNYSIKLDSKNIQPYTSQFVDNMSWSEYQKWGAKNVLLLNPGDSYDFGFGKMTFSIISRSI